MHLISTYNTYKTVTLSAVIISWHLRLIYRLMFHSCAEHLTLHWTRWSRSRTSPSEWDLKLKIQMSFSAGLCTETAARCLFYGEGKRYFDFKTPSPRRLRTDEGPLLWSVGRHICTRCLLFKGPLKCLRASSPLCLELHILAHFSIHTANQCL